MSSSDDFEEVDIDSFPEKPNLMIFQKSRHHKVFSDTISTNSCTFELERPSYHPSSSKLFTEMDKFKGSHKELNNKTKDLPERLISLKQISENKVKFMKVEKELKELEQCTFKPKTNVKVVKSSLKNFEKKQKDYIKTRNSTILKLKLKHMNDDANRKTTPILSSTCKSKQVNVHDRLYNQAKVFSRLTKHK